MTGNIDQKRLSKWALKMMTSVQITVTLNMCVCVHMQIYRYSQCVGGEQAVCVPWYMCRGQLTNVQSQFSPSIFLWVLQAYLTGVFTHWAISLAPELTLNVTDPHGNTGSKQHNCVCSLRWMEGTCKLLSICFSPCQRRMPLCQLCGSLWERLHFAHVTEGRAERIRCKYSKEQLIMENETLVSCCNWSEKHCHLGISVLPLDLSQNDFCKRRFAQPT